MPTSASCLLVRLVRRSPGKTTTVGWRGLGVAGQQASARSASTKGCRGLMVRIALGLAAAALLGALKRLSTESVTPPLSDRPLARADSRHGMCVCVCVCGSPSMRRQGTGLHHLPPPPARSPHCRVRQDPRPNRKPQAHKGRIGFCKLQSL